MSVAFADRPQPPMEASKWLKVQVLLDVNELEALFAALSNFSLYYTAGVVPIDKGRIEIADFLSIYGKYIESLKQGKVPSVESYQKLFSSVMSVTTEALHAIRVGEDKQLIRVHHPVVQLQPHVIAYSPHDKKFHSNVFGSGTVTWGLQFSYPQFFLNPKTRDPYKVDESELFPNTKLFKSIQYWIRHNTVPTPVIVDGTQMNLPIRIGPGCFSWINHHPQLAIWRVRR